MKSNNFRILIGDDGKKYQFDNECFSETIKNLTGRTVRTEEQRNHRAMTQISLMERIADKACVSLEAVKNWKYGANGPSSVEIVKACADVLGVDYSDLLIPLENQEENKMNKRDKELVEAVFGEIISLAYLVKQQHMELLNLKDNKERNTITRTVNSEELDAKIEQIHKMVDTRSLLVSETVRYKLHRILIELKDYFVDRNWTIERWEEINTTKMGR